MKPIKIEMSRLEKMVDILLSFVTADTMQLFSHDLNEIVLQRLEHHQKNAKKIGVKFEAQFDEGGCPSRVNTETIEWIIDQIIQCSGRFVKRRYTPYSIGKTWQ